MLSPECLIFTSWCFIFFVFFFLQAIPTIPDDLKELYKTVWEISQKVVIKMAADRGAFIDQSQSLNIHIAEPNYGKLTSMHFYGWKQVSQKFSIMSFGVSLWLHALLTHSIFSTGA